MRFSCKKQLLIKKERGNAQKSEKGISMLELNKKGKQSGKAILIDF